MACRAATRNAVYSNISPKRWADSMVKWRKSWLRTNYKRSHHEEWCFKSDRPSTLKGHIFIFWRIMHNQRIFEGMSQYVARDIRWSAQCRWLWGMASEGETIREYFNIFSHPGSRSKCAPFGHSAAAKPLVGRVHPTAWKVIQRLNKPGFVHKPWRLGAVWLSSQTYFKSYCASAFISHISLQADRERIWREYITHMKTSQIRLNLDSRRIKTVKNIEINSWYCAKWRFDRAWRMARRIRIRYPELIDSRRKFGDRRSYMQVFLTSHSPCTILFARVKVCM